MQWRISTERTIQVPLVRLDEHAERETLPAPDLLKLDVQGFELSVREGAGRLLDGARALIIEISFEEFYERQSTWFDIGEVLTRRGFDLHALASTTPLGSRLLQTDALFVRRAAD